jgi:SAM-dependent methyltransferase
MNATVERLLDTYYPRSAEGIRRGNGTKPFYDWLLGGIDASKAVVLNVGAGPTPSSTRRLRGRVKRLVGVDPDPIVRSNTDLDEAYVNDGVQLPFDDASFDAVYSDWTLEHVDRPAPFLTEIVRVLKPGAYFWFRTSNRWHYVTLVSALSPQWFHRLVANRARALPKDAHEPWPTRYRMNTPPALRKTLQRAGFEGIDISLMEAEPTYMLFSPLAFRLGIGYERLVNGSRRLSNFRLIMFGRARAPE